MDLPVIAVQGLGVFHGKSLLIVDAGHFLNKQARLMLEAAGARILGPVSMSTDARLYLETDRVDGAILDMYLDDETLVDVNDELEERDVPFIFATSLSRHQLSEGFSGYRLVDDAVELAKIGKALFEDFSRPWLH